MARLATGWSVDTILVVIALILGILALAGVVSATLALAVAVILLALARLV